MLNRLFTVWHTVKYRRRKKAKLAKNGFTKKQGDEQKKSGILKNFIFRYF